MTPAFLPPGTFLRVEPLLLGRVLEVIRAPLLYHTSLWDWH